MRVTILYFAALRELVARGEEQITLPADVASVGDLARHLGALYPTLTNLMGHVRFARNEEFARPSDAIADGDVIALIPPVAGG